MNFLSANNLRIGYILYLVGAFVGVTMFVGVIIAYVERGKTTDVLIESHANRQIRMFWIWLWSLGLLLMIGLLVFFSAIAGVGDVTGFLAIGVGYLVVYFTVPFILFLYILINSVSSLKKLDRGDPVPGFY